MGAWGAALAGFVGGASGEYVKQADEQREWERKQLLMQAELMKSKELAQYSAGLQKMNKEYVDASGNLVQATMGPDGSVAIPEGATSMDIMQGLQSIEASKASAEASKASAAQNTAETALLGKKMSLEERKVAADELRARTDAAGGGVKVTDFDKKSLLAQRTMIGILQKQKTDDPDAIDWGKVSTADKAALNMAGALPPDIKMSDKPMSEGEARKEAVKIVAGMEKEDPTLFTGVPAVNSIWPGQDKPEIPAKNREEIINSLTREIQGESAPSSPKTVSVPVGTVRNGYRFKGGNPNDKNSWEKI